MTKKPSPDKFRDLTSAQLIAIDALVAGASKTEAAEIAGVNRVTVSKWANHHPGFQAERNRRRAELIEQRADQIRNIDALVLEHIQRRVEGGDSAAVDTWVKARGLAKVDTSQIGATDTEAIIDAKIDERVNAIEHDILYGPDEADLPIIDGQPLAPGRDGIRNTIETEIHDSLRA
ncbi:MAG: hypothetical protein GY788_01495 [bacterium]|nr:hypothetical protein [bacterium]